MKERGQGHDWVKTLHETITGALKEHLREMRDEGMMQPILGSAGHRVPFIDTWAMMRSGDYPATYPDWYPEQLLESVADQIMTSTQGPNHDLSIRGMIDPCTSEADALELLLATLESGNFRVFDGGRNCCQVDNQIYPVLFEGWVPRAVLRQTEEPIEPITPDVGLAAVHLEVEFPSGDLLISDTFEVEEFVERVRADIGEESMTDFGRILRSKRFAAEGIAHVFHPHGASVISMANGGINFVDFEDPDDVRLGLDDRPESDLWALSVIDRETFVGIVQAERDCSQEEAIEIVDIAAERAITRKVEPGTYHLYFGTNDDVRLDEYDIEGIDQVGLSEIMVLSPEPLELTPKPGSRIEEIMGGNAPKM